MFGLQFHFIRNFKILKNYLKKRFQATAFFLTDSRGERMRVRRWSPTSLPSSGTCSILPCPCSCQSSPAELPTLLSACRHLLPLGMLTMRKTHLLCWRTELCINHPRQRRRESPLDEDSQEHESSPGNNLSEGLDANSLSPNQFLLI